MFVQIVITKVGENSYKVTYFNEKEVVHSEKMTATEVSDTMFTSLQHLRIVP